MEKLARCSIHGETVRNDCAECELRSSGELCVRTMVHVETPDGLARLAAGQESAYELICAAIGYAVPCRKILDEHGRVVGREWRFDGTRINSTG